MKGSLYKGGIVKFTNIGGKIYFRSTMKKTYTISQAAHIICDKFTKATPEAYNSIRRNLYSSIRSGQLQAVKDDTYKMWLISTDIFYEFLKVNNYAKQLSYLDPV